MNEQEHANKLAEEGEYNTLSALARINEGKTKADRLTKTEFYKRLRHAGFLGTGFTSKPHDPIHNKPFKWIREKGFSKKEKLSYHPKGNEDVTHYYEVAVYTKEGIKVIERIINEPEFNLHSLKVEAQKPAPPPKPTPREIEKSKEQHNRFLDEFHNIFKAS